MMELSWQPLSEIAVLGAHCDDIAIGMGATLLTIARAHPGIRVRALVLSGGGSAREDEEHAALRSFAPGAKVDSRVLGIADGRFPEHWGAVKDAIGDFRRSVAPDLVFAPQRHDAHQDHRTVATIVPTEFRDHLTLRYEIVKWESDTPAPEIFIPVSPETAQEKADLLRSSYPSQIHRDWFDEATFLGLSRLRGLQCRHQHAEAFMSDKLSINVGGR